MFELSCERGKSRTPTLPLSVCRGGPVKVWDIWEAMVPFPNTNARTQLYNDFLEWPFNVVSSQEKFKLKRAAHSHVDAVGCALHLIREVLFKACQSTNAHSISISLGKSFHMSSLWKILYNLEIALCRKVKFFPPLETKSLMGNFEKY